MRIIPPRKEARVLGATFTGEVFPAETMPPDHGVAINTIDFAPGARTFWHRHERGQVLVVLAGSGLVQADGVSLQTIRTGDTVWAPPDERHWHGAGPESFLVHTAISLGQTTWETEVTEAEYGAPVQDTHP